MRLLNSARTRSPTALRRRSRIRAATSCARVSNQAESSRGGAAALDGDVVPRSQWPSTTLRDGSVVEIVTAVQGG